MPVRNHKKTMVFFLQINPIGQSPYPMPEVKLAGWPHPTQYYLLVFQNLTPSMLDT
jgi:hypothetical protein